MRLEYSLPLLAETLINGCLVGTATIAAMPL
jgi:hypothetical protein